MLARTGASCLDLQCTSHVSVTDITTRQPYCVCSLGIAALFTTGSGTEQVSGSFKANVSQLTSTPVGTSSPKHHVGDTARDHLMKPLTLVIMVYLKEDSIGGWMYSF